MEKKSLEINFLQYNNKSELSEIQQELVSKAEEILNTAYAVYSGFHVGAALLLESGEIITGNNQENIAFPSSLCAERVALYFAKAHHPDAVVKKIAIMAKSSKGELLEVISPCGSCRQVMSEYERIQNEPMEVIIKGKNETMIVFEKVEDLLPFSFSTKVLG